MGLNRTTSSQAGSPRTGSTNNVFAKKQLKPSTNGRSDSTFSNGTKSPAGLEKSKLSTSKPTKQTQKPPKGTKGPVAKSTNPNTVKRRVSKNSQSSCYQEQASGSYSNMMHSSTYEDSQPQISAITAHNSWAQGHHQADPDLKVRKRETADNL